jgi:hypothetical protein
MVLNPADLRSLLKFDQVLPKRNKLGIYNKIVNFQQKILSMGNFLGLQNSFDFHPKYSPLVLT